MEPDEYTTPDGYTFRRRPDGSYADGDLTYENYTQLAAESHENGTDQNN